MQRGPHAKEYQHGKFFWWIVYPREVFSVYPWLPRDDSAEVSGPDW